MDAAGVMRVMGLDHVAHDVAVTSRVMPIFHKGLTSDTVPRRCIRYYTLATAICGASRFTMTSAAAWDEHVQHVDHLT